MDHKSTVIHCNRSLEHQKQLAGQLRKGFAKHGINAEISYRADTGADTHVVLGPWFAFEHWQFANTLMIDRAYWGDPDCVAIHWLKDGEKVFTKGRKQRAHPKLKKLKEGDSRIYLCDFRQEPEGDCNAVRYHPTEGKAQGTLEEALKPHQIAVGRRSTALVDAAIQGLRVETSDPHSPVYNMTNRRQWIRDLAWHNWSRDEITSGEFLDGIGKPDGTY